MIDALKDGEWHLIAEVVEKCDFSMDEAKSLIEFLRKYEFIEVDAKTQEIRITSSLQKFLLKANI
jgi:predicted transcriptional regulator